VELVDVYSTLCDLAGIDIPNYLQGTSFKPLLGKPDREWKSAAFSQFQRRPRESIDGKNYMGYSMITDKYHYVEWYAWDTQNKISLDLKATELYDMLIDPNENINVSNRAENKILVDELSAQLKGGWKNAKPKK
jgi:iduronate 2-sulfatase